ncbi:MAG: hypothetical protein DRP45_04340 [Candidatus Zixiibacteriota bacterium]|nr:MAG: hypothetical protein DRP45_04340 [candidate division Zixibacteria bacterium]
MARIGRSPEKKKGARYGAASLYMAIPTMLVAGPLVGFFLGRWADEKLETEPYLMLVGLVFGFAAAGREIYNLIRKAEQIERKESKD